MSIVSSGDSYGVFASATEMPLGPILPYQNNESLNAQPPNSTRSFTDTMQQQSGYGGEVETDRAYLDMPFQIKVNQTLFVESERLNITFFNVDDSRCPIGANCIWEGEGDIVLGLSRGAGSANVTLGIGSTLAANTTQTAIGYDLHLLSLQPYPTISSATNKTTPAYVATIVVSKAGTQISITPNKMGDRVGPLEITKIFPDHVEGLFFREFPLTNTAGMPISIAIGDSIDNGCNVRLVLLTVQEESAFILKIAEPKEMCPL